MKSISSCLQLVDIDYLVDNTRSVATTNRSSFDRSVIGRLTRIRVSFIDFLPFLILENKNIRGNEILFPPPISGKSYAIFVKIEDRLLNTRFTGGLIDTY